MNESENAVILLTDRFSFGGLENYLLFVRQMCQEEDLKCFLVSIQKSDNEAVYSLSDGEFLNLRLPIYAQSLARLFRNFRPAVVHAQSYYSLILSSLMKGVFGYRSVCTLHNPLSVTERQGLLGRLLPFFLTPDLLISPSQEVLGETLNRFKIRAKERMVIHNWVDTDKFSLCEKKDKHKILFLGRLDQQKKIEMLPRIVRDLRVDMPQIELNVCGVGPMAYILHGIDGIVYHGMVDEGTLVKMVQRSAVVVLPTNFEAMPLAILEALACGTPVVASPVGGIREIGRSSYGCFLAEDEEFPDVVRRILSENIDYARIHSEAVRNFSYKRGKEQMIRVYRHLLDAA